MAEKKEKEPSKDFGAQEFAEKDGKLYRKVDGAAVVLRQHDPSNPGKIRAKVTTQDVVDRYFVQRKLNWRQWKAADHIRRAFHTARFDTVKVSNLLGTGGGRDKATNFSDAALYARREYQDYVAALGPIGEKAIFWIVVSGWSASDFAHREGLGRDDGMGILRITLTTLADLYGLPQNENERG